MVEEDVGLEELIFGISMEEILLRVIAIAVVIGIAFAAYKILMIPVRRLTKKGAERKVGGSIFQNLVRVLVWGWAICGILDIAFNIDMAGILGALGVVGIAVSLGAQQTIANVIGGMIVSLSQMVGPGDWVTIDGHKEACVIDTNWRRTTLQDEDGVLFAVPNSYMVSNVVEKGNPYYMVAVPFAIKATTPDVEGLLAECEQALLDRQVAGGYDYEQKRPKAHINGSGLGTIEAEVKLYVNRAFDTRTVKRAVLPALIDLLQERGAIAELSALAE